MSVKCLAQEHNTMIHVVLRTVRQNCGAMEKPRMKRYPTPNIRYGDAIAMRS